MKIGDKVTYVGHNKLEYGIIKSLCESSSHYFVVYNCGGEWDNYMNYTAARTKKSDLVEGWR